MGCDHPLELIRLEIIRTEKKLSEAREHVESVEKSASGLRENLKKYEAILHQLYDAQQILLERG
jgi:hypothetical protein